MGLFSGISKVFKKATKVLKPVVSVAAPLLGGGGIGSTLISGGLSLLGGERRNSAQAAAAADATEFNAAEAQKNRDFQAQQSSTAYQRAVTDLRKAGLNPILAARNPASTPGGAQATAVMPQLQDTITPAINSARSVYDTTNLATFRDIQGDTQGAQQDKIEKEIDQIVEQTALTREQGKLVAEQINKTIQEAKRTIAETTKTDLQNIPIEIVSEFLKDNPNLARTGEVSRQIGLKASDFTSILNKVLDKLVASKGDVVLKNKPNLGN